MSRLDRDLFAEKAAVIERHLARVAERLPLDAEEFRPMTDASDAVILHLWQAVQAIIDLATSACIHFHLNAPQNYGEAFERLSSAGYLDPDLTARLIRAAGFRNVVAHTYEKIEMDRVYRAAQEGPADLRAFLVALESRL